MDGTYGCRFGSLDFSPAAQTRGAAVEWHVFGLKRGRPVPMSIVARSMMQDGAREIVTGHTNRDQTLVIGVRGADSQRLAAAETALWLEAQKPQNELAWIPPDRHSATTVFDIEWCDLSGVDDPDDWDLEELKGCRVYTLSLRAQPFGRAETETIVEALDSGAVPSSTVISAGSSAANWTGTGAVTSSGGWLQQTVASALEGFGMGVFLYGSTAEWTYTPAAPLDFSAEVYLSFDFDPPGSASSGYLNSEKTKLFADGVEQLRVAVDQPTASVYRVTFLVTDPSVSVLKLVTGAQTESTTYPAPSLTHKIDNVTKSNQAPGASATGRQSMRTIEVKGSARTPASLAIQHETDSLGAGTLVYTSPRLESPPSMRRWRSAGDAGSADATSVSGTTSLLTGGSAATFNVPSSALVRGTCAMLGRLRMSSSSDRTGRVSWSAGTKVGGTVYGEESFTSPDLSLLRSSLAFRTVYLGAMTLPPVDMPAGSSGTVEISDFTWSGSDNVYFDDLWLYWLGDGAALSWVDASGFQRLWIEPASISNDVPSWWLSDSADRTDGIHAGGLATGVAQHEFRPPFVNIHVVTPDAVNPAVSGRYYRRVHTHIEKEDA